MDEEYVPGYGTINVGGSDSDSEISEINGKLDNMKESIETTKNIANIAKTTADNVQELANQLDMTLSSKISDKADVNHAAMSTVHGVGNASYYGHLRLVNSTSNNATTGTACTPAAVKSAYDLAQSAYSLALSAGGTTLTSTQLKAINGLTSSEIAIGYSANAVSSCCTAIGSEAEASGEGCVAIGAESNTYGDMGCVAIGYKSGAYASNAVAIGYRTLCYYESDTALGSDIYINKKFSTAVGYNARCNKENSLQLGSSTLSGFYCAVDLTVSSDERDKTDITDIDHSLEFLRKIKAVRYLRNPRTNYQSNDDHLSEEEKQIRLDYDVYKYDREAHERGDKKGSRYRVGVLAQDVQKAMEEVYHTDNYANIVNDNFYDYKKEEIPEGVENSLSVTYNSFIPFLIKAIQELDERNKNLEERISILEK